MYELKSVKAMEERSKEILERREADLADREEKLAAAKEAEAAAQAAAEAAVVSGDKAAYHEAQVDINWAKESIEMCEKRLHDLKEEPLVRKEEYEAKVAAVFDEVNARTAEAKARVVELVEELQKVADEYGDACVEANKALKEWQGTIYRHADCHVLKTGYISPTELKEIRDFSICDFARFILNTGVYKDIKGE